MLNWDIPQVISVGVAWSATEQETEPESVSEMWCIYA